MPDGTLPGAYEASTDIGPTEREQLDHVIEAMPLIADVCNADLLLYAKTLSYLFTLARELAPEVDPMPLTVPWLLRFLAVRDPAPTTVASAAGAPGAG